MMHSYILVDLPVTPLGGILKGEYSSVARPKNDDTLGVSQASCGSLAHGMTPPGS